MAARLPANFELHIRQPFSDGSCPVTARVLVTDQMAEGLLALPLEDAATAAFLDAWQDGLIDTREAQEFGARLFSALFRDKIRDLYIAVRAQHGQMFRYRLILDSPGLARLPWELMYDPERRAFLTLETSLVRGFGLMEPTQAVQVQPPLRVLVSAAFPSDLPSIEGQDEIDAILDELADLVRRKDAEVTPLVHASLRTLQNVLREAANKGEPFHVLHVIAHGTLDLSNGNAVLYFETEQGQAQPVDPPALADVLRPFDLKLIYLNACETAALSAFDVTRGFAPALMAIGTPAVIGMQIAVWDQSARQVAQDFYAALADNQPVDQALLSARQLARNETSREANIAIPVCYLRTASGQIVDLIRPGAPRLSRATWRDWLKVVATPKKLGQGLLAFIGLVSALLGIYWGIVEFARNPTSTQLPPLAGDFKIAVAAFSEVDSSGNAVRSVEGARFAQSVADEIDREIQSLREAGFVIPPLYGPDKVGFIAGSGDSERAQNAARRAQELSADLLLHGYLVQQRDNTSLTPYVYISSNRLDYASELAGNHQFGSPLQVPEDIRRNLVASKDLGSKLGQRSIGLAKFVVGLAYFKSNELLQAARWLDDAYRAGGDDAMTQRLVLLFLGSTAARQNDLPTARHYFQRALQADPNYARAELGRSQIQLLEACTPDQIDISAIEEAIAGYQRALTMDSQPADEIRTKSSLFLGHAYLCWSLATPDSQRAESESLRSKADSAYRYVVNRYRETGDPAIQYLAAAAWLGLGGMYAATSNEGANRDLVAQAAEAYGQTVELSRQPIEQATAHLGLALVHVWRSECQRAMDERGKSDAIYQETVASNPNLRDQPYEAFWRSVESVYKDQCPW